MGIVELKELYKVIRNDFCVYLMEIILVGCIVGICVTYFLLQVSREDHLPTPTARELAEQVERLK